MRTTSLADSNHSGCHGLRHRLIGALVIVFFRNRVILINAVTADTHGTNQNAAATSPPLPLV